MIDYDFETSRPAWASFDTAAPTVDEKIIGHLRSVGGATSDEVEVALNLKHQTVSAQLRHLAERKRVVKTDEKRPTRSGRNARVFQVAA